MSLKPCADVQKAIQKEGYLYKKIPSMFMGSQKRYFKFTNMGNALSYAEKKKDFDEDKIKGQILMKDILEINDDENSKRFQIIIEGRVYKLEAENEDDKNEWIVAIVKAKTYAADYEKHRRDSLLRLDSNIKYEDYADEDDEEEKKGSSDGVFSLLKNATKKIVVDYTLGTATSIIKTGVSTVGSIFKDNTKHTNAEFLDAKGYKAIFDMIDPKILRSRMVIGYLTKHATEATGLGKLDTVLNDTGMRDVFILRWCLLVSSKPILPDKVDTKDEEILDKSKLPFDIEPDVLYTFNPFCDKSKAVESFEMKDLEELIVNKKKREDHFYKFTLDYGNKIFKFLCESAEDRDKWIMAIQMSRATVKEIGRSHGAEMKNLYWILKTMDEEENGAEKLRKKIEADYEKLTSVDGVMRVDNIHDLIFVQEKVARDFIALVNACLAHKEKRVDIIRLYVEGYHQHILNALKNYFRRNKDDLENQDIFQMIKFLILYRNKLEELGTAFVDKRISQGISTLCKIVGRRVFKLNLETVNSVIKTEMRKEPELDGRGRPASTAPIDIFKIANESFNILEHCNTVELALALLQSCAHTMEYFQSGLHWMISNHKGSVDQFCALCNNSLQFISRTKEFLTKAEVLASSMKDEIPLYFDDLAVKKGFALIGQESFQKVIEKIVEDHFKILTLPKIQRGKGLSFLEVDLEATLKDIDAQLVDTMDKLHQSFRSKKDAIYLEKIVVNYIQTFLDSAQMNKLGQNNALMVMAKFGKDIEIINQEFAKMPEEQISSSIGSIMFFFEFFTESYENLPNSVMKLKQQYGYSILWKTIELLLKLRENDIPKDKRSKILKDCQNVYKVTKQIENSDQHFNVFKRVSQDLNKIQGLKELGKQYNLDEDLENEEKKNENGVIEAPIKKFSHAQTMKYSFDGYLEVDKNQILSNIGAIFLKDLKFERRYFTLRNNVLYCYNNKDSENSICDYQLSDFIECKKVKEDNEKVMFYIKMKGKNSDTEKVLNLKAETVQKKLLWIKTINEAMKVKAVAEIFGLNDKQAKLFFDQLPIFEDIEDLPALQFPIYLQKPKSRTQDISQYQKTIDEDSGEVRRRTIIFK